MFHRLPEWLSVAIRAKATLSAYHISYSHLTPMTVPPQSCRLVPDTLPGLPVLFTPPRTRSPVLIKSGTLTRKLSSSVPASTSSQITKQLMSATVRSLTLVGNSHLL